jgi:hypothetical protein
MLLGHYLEQGAGDMKLGLSRRAVYHWIQTAQLDRDGAGRVKEQLPAHTGHQRYPRHRKTLGRAATTLAEHTLG